MAGGTHFEALRSVHLDEIYLTDSMLSDLIAGCVNLERLSIYRCYGMKDMKIVLSKLKNLTLFHFNSDEGSLQICAPILRRLYIAFFEVGNYLLEDASSLVEANICFVPKAENYAYWSKLMRLLGHVEHLSLQNWGYKICFVGVSHSTTSPIWSYKQCTQNLTCAGLLRYLNVHPNSKR